MSLRRDSIDRILESNAHFLLYYKIRNSPVGISRIQAAQPGQFMPVHENREFILYRIARNR